MADYYYNQQLLFIEHQQQNNIPTMSSSSKDFTPFSGSNKLFRLNESIDPSGSWKLQKCKKTSKERIVKKNDISSPYCSHIFEDGKLTDFLVNFKKVETKELCPECMHEYVANIDFSPKAQNISVNKNKQDKESLDEIKHSHELENIPYDGKNIIELAKNNVDYRHVVYSHLRDNDKETFRGKGIQVVVMNLRSGENINREVHKNIDQIFFVIEGQATITYGKTLKKKPEDETKIFSSNELCIIPQNWFHEVKNNGKDNLKFFTIYSSQEHDPKTIQNKKPNSQKVEDVNANINNEISKDFHHNRSLCLLTKNHFI